MIEPDFARRGEEYGRLRKELRGLGVAMTSSSIAAASRRSGVECPAASFTGCSGKAVSSAEPDLSETSRILLKKAEEDATVREFAGALVCGLSVAFRSHLGVRIGAARGSHDAPARGTTEQEVGRRYSIVRVPSMPASRWPGMLQKKV